MPLELRRASEQVRGSDALGPLDCSHLLLRHAGNGAVVQRSGQVEDTHHLLQALQLLARKHSLPIRDVHQYQPHREPKLHLPPAQHHHLLGVNALVLHQPPQHLPAEAAGRAGEHVAVGPQSGAGASGAVGGTRGHYRPLVGRGGVGDHLLGQDAAAPHPEVRLTGVPARGNHRGLSPGGHLRHLPRKEHPLNHQLRALQRRGLASPDHQRPDHPGGRRDHYPHLLSSLRPPLHQLHKHPRLPSLLLLGPISSGHHHHARRRQRRGRHGATQVDGDVRRRGLGHRGPGLDPPHHVQGQSRAGGGRWGVQGCGGHRGEGGRGRRRGGGRVQAGGEGGDLLHFQLQELGPSVLANL
mmetsp:Transcript_8740/g.20822  ORF Transcript_8740/g.20822 Transcript_8740/m.20822 type:complete len:354 (-) Transcript_8740:373-1434(-)